MKKRKTLKWTVISGLIISLLFILIANYRIKHKTESQIYTNTVLIPHNKVGV